MANKVWRVKSGMGGSRCGRGRSEGTATMKTHSKKFRRKENKTLIYDQLMEHQLEKFSLLKEYDMDFKIFFDGLLQGLRFPSNKGFLTTEELFKLPLTTIKPDVTSLDSLAQQLNEVFQKSQVSFVNDTSSENKTLKLQLDIVLAIIQWKKDENKTALEAKLRREQKDKLLTLIEKKKEAALESLPVDELEKMLEKI